MRSTSVVAGVGVALAATAFDPVVVGVGTTVAPAAVAGGCTAVGPGR